MPEKYVNSLKAPLYAEADLASALLVDVKRGEKLQIIATEGIWSQVVYNQDTTGWVYSMLLVDKMAERSNSSLAKSE